MRKLLIATLSSGMMLGTIAVAQAMPFSNVSSASAPEITLVAGGCGPGFHRGPYGGCRPNGYAPYYGRPVYRAPVYRPVYRGPVYRGPYRGPYYHPGYRRW